MTQELIANMLGAAPPGRDEEWTSSVTPAGAITVLDRKGLEKRGSECYAVVKNEYDRLLSGKAAR